MRKYFSLSYVIISGITALVAFLGSVITSRGLSWYETLKLPSFTPSGGVIGAAWTVIFILTALSAIVFWNRAFRNARFLLIITLFLINALLNILWSYLFFGIHVIGAALLEMIILWLTTLVLIILIRPTSRLASTLLFPYLIWVAFAAYLTYTILTLNI